MKDRNEAGRTARMRTAREHYLAAWRWRRRVEGEVLPLGLTFTQWFVLEATAHGVQEEEDAVSQNQVAEKTELDRKTISQVMHALDALGMVDRAPDHTGRAYRIYVTTKGERVLRQANARIEALPAPSRGT